MPNGRSSRSSRRSSRRRSSVLARTSFQRNPLVGPRQPNAGRGARRRGAARNTAPQYGLSGCAQKYAAAQCDPRGAEPGCLPDGRFPIPVQGIKVQARGTFVIGTTGLGVAAFNPGAAVFNDLTCLTTTTGAYTGTLVPAIAAANTTAVVSDSEFTSADAGTGANSIQWRVVSAGMYVKNVSALQLTRGIVVAAIKPQHDSFSGASAATLRLTAGAREWSASQICLDQEAKILSGPPVHPAEYEFQTLAAGTNGTWTETGGVGPMVVACTGGVVGDTFDVICYSHLEVSGNGAQGAKPAGSDPVGTAAVARASGSFLQNTEPGVSAASQWPTVAQFMSKAVGFLRENSGYMTAAAGMMTGAYAGADRMRDVALLVGNRQARRLIRG